MSALLWVAVLAPFAGALILLLAGAMLPKKLVAVIACASIGVSWIAALILGWSHMTHRLVGGFDATLYTWMNVAGLKIPMGLHLDWLSLVWLEIVTFVGFLIVLYASQSMREEDGYARFFGYMMLFLGSMLTLVLANNLLLLYLGWEGVGLCSYLLIGFWYKEKANCDAARKAFIVTRIGDTALAIALFMLYIRFGTFDIVALMGQIATLPAAAATIIALLVLGGAVGKSAQLPLQTWLPDAMAGPTPVSALIHAATMVTAGVYLIARLGPLFTEAPVAMLAVAVVGAVTLIYAGITALVQHDIKRVLAYSTMSQIGYMFLALGVGAWGAAAFHFVTHAFFKALLFLAAGVVIDAQHHEHDIFKMGGLRRSLPLAFWTLLIGAASLSALPFVTAGFYSKEVILYEGYLSPMHGKALMVVGLIGALITAAYSFRVVLRVFFGEQQIPVTMQPGSLMKFVLVVLSFFSIFAGFVVFPAIHLGVAAEQVLVIISSILSLGGIYLAYLYLIRPGWSAAVAESPAGRALHRFFFTGWGFDWLYEHVFVIPLKWIAHANWRDFIDRFFVGLGETARYSGLTLSRLQTGRVRNYAVGLVMGAIAVAATVLWR